MARRYSPFALPIVACCLVVAPLFLSGCCRTRYCCVDNTPVQLYGTRAVLNPAANWGSKTRLQDAWTIEALNGFFSEHAEQLGLASDLCVRPHPDGASLLYCWTDSAGDLKVMTQTARQSFWFNLVSLGGRFGNAQERDWGFVSTPKFVSDWRENRAVTVFHEFWHQHTQVKRCGVARYWLAYARQFLTSGYANMPLEKEAYAASDLFEKYIESRYGVRFVAGKAKGRCGHMRTEPF